MNAIPNYKDIVDLLKKGATLEAQEKIMELRKAALELQEENLRLRTRVSDLEGQLGLADTMAFRKPFYYRSDDEHPHCPVCWEKDKTPIHLKGPEGDAEWFTCPVCKWCCHVKPDHHIPIAAFPRHRDRSVLL